MFRIQLETKIQEKSNLNEKRQHKSRINWLLELFYEDFKEVFMKILEQAIIVFLKPMRMEKS